MNRRDFLCRSASVGATALGIGAGRSALSLDRAPSPHRRAATGPLRVHPANRRYFTDGSGRAIYLTGSHMWNNLVDMGPSDPPPRFDFAAYLDWLEKLHHNFIRLWTWELVTWNTAGNSPRHRKEPKAHTVAPQPWVRSGPGKALDGKPKYDFRRFDPAYFDRLKKRVGAAGARGIYVSVMCFEGWGLQRVAEGFKSHPFHPANNVSGINGDANGDGMGLEVHTLANRAVTKTQEAYVKKIVDTVGDLDNVLYEISNENHPASTEWQYHMIDFIHRYEQTRRKQHAVGMTFQFQGGSNRTLFDGPADWISPNNEGGYRENPPAADGSKVILSDTDHLWGIGGNRAWVWKTFCRGLNPIFMDPYDGLILGNRFDPKWEPIRRSLGYTLRYAQRMNLASMTPHNALASTGYCLANPAQEQAEYLVYLPAGGKATVDLSATAGPLLLEWFDPNTGKAADDGTTRGGARRTFSAPFNGDSVLYLYRREQGRD